MAKPIADRILSKIERIPFSGCWIYMGSLNHRGYGLITWHNKQGRFGRAAHRVLWESVRGPVPEGLQLDHLCRVRCCCNPLHLEPVTPKENQRRGKSKWRTHCPRGHEYQKKSKNGWNVCFICNREFARKSNEKRAALRAAKKL